MAASTLLRAGCANVSLLCIVFLALSRAVLADSILAFAPVAALAGLEGLNVRHLAAACPASTQTACADGLGCCPSGAACTYSRDVPVCDESCNGGPNCSNGGCCQTGYVCGTTNNFCSPAAKPTKAAAPGSVSASGNGDGHNDSIAGTATAFPSAPLQAEPTTGGSDDGGSVHLPTPTKTPSVPSSHGVASATSTASRGGGTNEGGGGKYVAPGSATNKTPSASAQTSSTGGAHSIEVGDTLMAVIIGWIAGLVVVM